MYKWIREFQFFQILASAQFVCDRPALYA